MIRAQRLIRTGLVCGLVAWAAHVVAQSAVDPGFAGPPVPDDSVASEVTIVGGNAASARERALEQALTVAVQRSFDAILEELGLVASGLPLPIKQLRATLGTQARELTESYRVLSQEQLGSRYRVRVEADVARDKIRRAIEKVRKTLVTVSGVATAVVVAGDEPVAVGLPLAQAMRSSGADIVDVDQPMKDVAAVRAHVASGGAAHAVVVLYQTESESLGRVRGAAQEVHSCHLWAGIFPPGASDPASSVSIREHGLALTQAQSRSACLSRALAGLSTRLLPELAALSGPVAGSASVTLRVVLDQPAALEILLARLGGLGGVERNELRRITVGGVDIRVTTLMSSADLAQKLTAAMAPHLVATVVGTTHNTAELKVAFPELTPEEPGSEAVPVVAPETP